MTGIALLIDTEQQLGAALASRIRGLRRERKLSLDGLATLTGLSKGTVVALEQGKANPSIGVLCRLAATFSLSVADLLSDSSANASESGIERTTPKTLWTSSKGSQAQLQASTSGRTMFELWSWAMMPGDEFRSDAHSPDTRELISVTQGSLRIVVGAESIALKTGENVRLVTDRAHSYAAADDQPVFFTMAVLEQGGPR